MKNLLVIQNKIANCEKCVSTQQMKASPHCSLSIVNNDGHITPECFVNIKNISQAERNFLTCPTYNLGMYEYCKACPLECPQNFSLSKNSPFFNIINQLAPLLGLTEDKKQKILFSLENLNNPDFKNIYSSLIGFSKIMDDIFKNKNIDLAKKSLELELGEIKDNLTDLISQGKITQKEVDLLNSQIKNNENFKEFGQILKTIKEKYNNPS